MGRLRWEAWRSNHAQAISVKERYLLVRQLAVLQRAGVPLLSSLHAIEAQLPSGALRQTLQEVGEELLNGQSLSQAITRQPHSFDPIFVGMVRVGEAGGLLEDVLKRLADLLAWEIELRSRIQQALQYPLIVLVTLLIAISIMVVFVLPRFGELFDSFKIALPVQTRVVVALSQFLAHRGWLLALSLLCAAAASWGFLQTDRGRRWWHRTLIRLPIIGPLLLQLWMSRFARTVSALTASGVPLLETLALAEENVNTFIQQGVADVRERVRGGETFASALKSNGLFPPVVVQMVATGEETGRLDELLHSVGDYYDQQVADAVKQLITYVEPLLLIVVGAGVLIMATAVLVPMWDLVRAFKTQGG